MKKTNVKRLLYFQVGTGKILYGGESYDENLTSHAILCSVYTAGKHVWSSNRYDYPALYQLDEHGQVKYIISVQKICQYQKSWYNLLWDWVRRTV